MKKVCVLTATRAEYGLLKNIIVELKNVNNIEVKVVVTGMHLSPEFGYTYKEIEQDGIEIDKKIEILLSSDSFSAVSKTMGLALIQFADYFEENKFDMLLVLGDRYETLAVCIAAVNQQIPIAHLYGGEITEGVMDESIRHAITKLSYLHFTSTQEYRKRVIQLGEEPDRVYCVGAMGIENILSQELMSLNELEENLHFSLGNRYAVVTFHPVTLENESVETQIKELIKAIDRIDDMHFIITKANADAKGRIINKLLDTYAMKNKEKVLLIESLGVKRYLSALYYSSMVIGNSSSGLVEAPTFHIPTVNIGNRQKGRLKAESVINCEPQCDSIFNAIQLAMTDKMKNLIMKSMNPYGDGHTSEKIVEKIKEVLFVKGIKLKKAFYDVDIK